MTINGQKIKLWSQDPDTKHWLGDWAVDSESDSIRHPLPADPGRAGRCARRCRQITRTFQVEPGSHTIELKQRVENLTDKPLKIQWEQLAQGDVHREVNDYLRGRSLHYVTGYFDDDYDAARFSIYVKDGFLTREDLIDELKNPKDTGKWSSVWPNPKVTRNKTSSWPGWRRRTATSWRSAPRTSSPTSKRPRTSRRSRRSTPTITTDIYPDAKADREMSDTERTVLIGLVSKGSTIAPGKQTKPSDLSLDLFVGPREDADLLARRRTRRCVSSARSATRSAGSAGSAPSSGWPTCC